MLPLGNTRHPKFISVNSQFVPSGIGLPHPVSGTQRSLWRHAVFRHRKILGIKGDSAQGYVKGKCAGIQSHTAPFVSSKHV